MLLELQVLRRSRLSPCSTLQEWTLPTKQYTSHSSFQHGRRLIRHQQVLQGAVLHGWPTALPIKSRADSSCLVFCSGWGSGSLFASEDMCSAVCNTHGVVLRVLMLAGKAVPGGLLHKCDIDDTREPGEAQTSRIPSHTPFMFSS